MARQVISDFKTIPRRSSGANGVTHTLWRANPARRPTLDSGAASIVGVDIVGTSL